MSECNDNDALGSRMVLNPILWSRLAQVVARWESCGFDDVVRIQRTEHSAIGCSECMVLDMFIKLF